MPRFVYVLRIMCIVIGFFCSTLAYADKQYGGEIVSVTPGSDAKSVDSTTDENKLSSTLCQIILMINGRIGRVIAAVAIFGIGIAFFMGKVTWPLLVTVAIGIGLLFGARNIAVALLPTKVSVYSNREKTVEAKTPDEIIRMSCPELS